MCLFSSNLHIDNSHGEFGYVFEKAVQNALNSNLFSNFKFNPGETPLHSLVLFEQKMSKMLYGTMRGTQNASELLPYLPFWLNSEKRCVESAVNVMLLPNQKLECWPNCRSVKWEDALVKAFVFNCKSVNKVIGKTGT